MPERMIRWSTHTMRNNGDNFHGLTIGLVGCGKWGRLILRDLQELGADVRVVAPSLETRSFAVAHGAVSIHQQISEIENSCDGYIVATPLTNHFDSIRCLVRTGKPIFSEKALTNSAEQADELVSLCGDRLFVMDKWRYHPGVQKIKEIVDAGRIGEITTIRLSRLGWGIRHDDVDGCWVLLPHDLSIVLHLLGDIPAVISVLELVPNRPELGMIIQLHDSTGPRVIIEFSVIHPELKRMLIVSGDKGSIALPDSYSPEVFLRSGAVADSSVPLEKVSAEGLMPLLKEIRHFLKYILGGPAPMSSAREGASVVRRIMEIRTLAGMS